MISYTPPTATVSFHLSLQPVTLGARPPDTTPGMASLDAILCSEPHAATFAYEPARQDVPVPDERDAAPDDKMALKPPVPFSGSRRKSGWGERCKEREQGRIAIIFPRRKMGEAVRGSDAVRLSVDVLNSLADRSLASAAKRLGISSSALKKACRELGVGRWPYCRKRQRDGGAAAASDRDAASRADTARGSTSPEPSVHSNGAPIIQLLDLPNRNVVTVLEAAKQLEGIPQAGAKEGLGSYMALRQFCQLRLVP